MNNSITAHELAAPSWPAVRGPDNLDVDRSQAAGYAAAIGEATTCGIGDASCVDFTLQQEKFKTAAGGQ